MAGKDKERSNAKADAIQGISEEAEYPEAEYTLQAGKLDRDAVDDPLAKKPTGDEPNTSNAVVSFNCKLHITRDGITTDMIGLFTAPEDGVYLTSKIVMELNAHWTSNMRVEIKVHRLCPPANPSARPVHDLLHKWIFRLNSDTRSQPPIIAEYPSIMPAATTYTEQFYREHALRDAKARVLRDKAGLLFLRLDFDPSGAHTQGILIDRPQGLPASLHRLHETLQKIFEPAAAASGAQEADAAAGTPGGGADQTEGDAAQATDAPKGAGTPVGGRWAVLEGLVSTMGGDFFLQAYKEVNTALENNRIYPPSYLWFNYTARPKSRITRGQITPAEQRPAVQLRYHPAYRNASECWIIEGFSCLQAEENQTALCKEARALECELRVMITSAGRDREYLGLIRLHDNFAYRFRPEDHFHVKIKHEVWTAHILPKPFIFSNSIDISVVLHRPLLDEGWSTLQLDSTFNLCDPELQKDPSQLMNWCYFGDPNKVSVLPIMSETPLKIKLAAIRLLNPAHLGETEYEHNDRFHDLLLGQDMRAKFSVNLFDGLDVFKLLREWDINLDDGQKAALTYFHSLPNGFGILKGPWGTGKTFFDVIIAMLLLNQGKRVKVVSSSNLTADGFILRLLDELARLKDKGIVLTEREVVRYHSTTIERQVIDLDSRKHVPVRENPERLRWLEQDPVPDFFYDNLARQLIGDSKRKTLHGILDRRYKLHQASLGTLFLKVTGLDQRDPPPADQVLPATAAARPTGNPKAAEQLRMAGEEEPEPSEEAEQADDAADDPGDPSSDADYGEGGTGRKRRPKPKSSREGEEVEKLRKETAENLGRLEAREGRQGLIDRFKAYFLRLERGEPLDKEDTIQYHMLEKKLLEDILIHDVGVVACTLVCSGHAEIRQFPSHHDIVQEAARAENAEVFVAMSARKPGQGTMHLSGDDEQLPPSQEDGRKNCFAPFTNVSYFERALLLGYPHVMLSQQYRTVPVLSRIISDLWYKGSVTTAVNPSTRPNVARVQSALHEFTDGQVNLPMAFLNVTGSKSVRVGATQSKQNETELAVAVKLAQTLISKAIPPKDIVMLSGYNAQVQALKRAVARLPALKDIEVCTIDSFQGWEASVIILSMTAVDRIGFMALPNRLLVGCSRSMDGFVILCNYDSLGTYDHARRVNMLARIKNRFEEERAYADISGEVEVPDFMATERALRGRMANPSGGDQPENTDDDANPSGGDQPENTDDDANPSGGDQPQNTGGDANPSGGDQPQNTGDDADAGVWGADAFQAATGGW